ncbi:MAG: cyclodeaminase/cyclohydrolase family protein [Halobacteriales archaeon]
MDYSEQTLDELLSRIASEQVTPAGGTASAVVGAIGAALCEMVCIHTIEKDEYEAVEGGLVDARDDLRRERSHLLGLADTDARVIADLFPVSGDEVDQSRLKQSIGVPLTIADASLTVLEIATEVTAKGTRTAVADAGTGVFLAYSALRASIFTARRNTEQVIDPSFVADIERRATEIEEASEDAYERAMKTIEERA